MLVAAVLVIVVPPLLGVWEWSTGFYRGLALLVASSPCAFALGTPATVLAGIAQAARRGVLIKGGMHLENLGTIKAIALDKTGTLTVGQPEVTDVVPAPGVSADELLRLAAAVERQSQHPLAAAVVRKAEAVGFKIDLADAVESVTGRGIRATVSGRRVEIGNARLFDDCRRARPRGDPRIRCTPSGRRAQYHDRSLRRSHGSVCSDLPTGRARASEECSTSCGRLESSAS